MVLTGHRQVGDGKWPLILNPVIIRSRVLFGFKAPATKVGRSPVQISTLDTVGPWTMDHPYLPGSWTSPNERSSSFLRMRFFGFVFSLSSLIKKKGHLTVSYRKAITSHIKIWIITFEPLFYLTKKNNNNNSGPLWWFNQLISAKLSHWIFIFIFLIRN